MTESGSSGSHRSRIGAALVVVLLTLSACATQPPTGSTPDASTSPPAATPTSTPTMTSPPDLDGPVKIDKKSSLQLSPVDYDGIQALGARFSQPVPGQPVLLQRKLGSTWETLSTGEQDQNGRVDFQTATNERASYRAVTLPAGASQDPSLTIATPQADAGTGWKQTLSSGFDEQELTNPWAHRLSGVYEAGGRQCAAPYPSNVTLRDGKIQLSVTKETVPSRISKARAAGCQEKNVYRNAMVATEGRFTVEQGVIAARVKFPSGQGMHGSVWLQSASRTEIDMIESYGYGAEMTSVAHIGGQQYPQAAKQAYVHTDTIRAKEWWKDYHVFSAEWNRKEIIYRIDGIETQRIAKAKPKANYFLVISLLTSDWEQKRFTNPKQLADNVMPTKLPQKMLVDWVYAWEAE